MLDGCGIETCSDPLGLYPGGLRSDRCSMAVESRLLLAERRTTVVLGSRSMLDGCGIETLREIWVRSVDPCSSRSMLDGCGIET